MKVRQLPPIRTETCLQLQHAFALHPVVELRNSDLDTTRRCHFAVFVVFGTSRHLVDDLKIAVVIRHDVEFVLQLN